MTTVLLFLVIAVVGVVSAEMVRTLLSQMLQQPRRTPATGAVAGAVALSAPVRDGLEG